MGQTYTSTQAYSDTGGHWNPRLGQQPDLVSMYRSGQGLPEGYLQPFYDTIRNHYANPMGFFAYGMDDDIYQRWYGRPKPDFNAYYQERRDRFNERRNARGGDFLGGDTGGSRRGDY